jgi:hypothetical protein
MTLWSGLDVRTDSAEDRLVIEHFYRDAYLNQIEEGNPDLSRGHRYELIAAGSRGAGGAALLTAFELSDARAAGPPGASQPLPSLPAPPAAWQDAVETSWSLIYRPVAETGPSLVAPYAIYMLGVNPPPKLSASERDAFNDFYTNVHMPEVAARRRCLRATRYELHRELRSPERGSPQFLAVYELDERAAAVRRHVGGAYAPGPDVWRRHTTPWRLWYRRLPD